MSIRNVAIFAGIASFGSLLSLPLVAQLGQNPSFFSSLGSAPAVAQEADDDGDDDDDDVDADAGYSQGVRALW